MTRFVHILPSRVDNRVTIHECDTSPGGHKWLFMHTHTHTLRCVCDCANCLMSSKRVQFWVEFCQCIAAPSVVHD